MKKTKKEGKLVWAWVDLNIRVLVRKLADVKGISVSEYLRQLILDDLDRRSFITTQLKNDVILESQETETNENKEVKPSVT
jgi:hypothetical protein